MNMTTQRAQRNVPFTANINIKLAANLAIWLIIDKKRTKKSAIDSAAKKYKDVKKIRIEEIIDIAIPKRFFEMRRAGSAVSSGAIRRMVDERMSAKQSESHIKDITERENEK